MMCFDEWSNCVLANCGHYYSRPVRTGRGGIGDFRLRNRHGVDIAEMNCQIDRIERLRAGIRRDDSEYLFLLLQKTGEMGVIHNGREEVLRPGDGLLMDSTRTAELRFEGRDASFSSVHLPRELCLEGRADAPAIGRRVSPGHPLHSSLMTLLAENGADETPADYLFDFIGLMFRAERSPTSAAGFRDRHGRFRFICETVERHLPDPDFSVEQLAVMVRMSRRQLQRDFCDNGTTFTRFLFERRLKLVASHLRRAAQLDQQPSISDLAYRAGFNDLSHFNRGFRQRYDMSPGGYHADHARRRANH
ncbi:helix-turn-helix domain-containing protein [Paracoccus marinaquae]|uniref:Helix-turn-helix domain-containing protein n=1 Tax=Paracoccus marinaquae TaxID=2841926 RepID=A0ABS6ADR3_9RHOB|nr:helix-turn-helix domain-containing protein [Paracoccus marinaquae]MBU3028740.1 helix-turn-helix domain-containing protein [Paracoccus marinaquae]